MADASRARHRSMFLRQEESMAAKRTTKRARAKKMRRQCGTMVVHNRLLERDPGFRMRLMALESATAQRMSMAKAAAAKQRTIKVVVHVVHNPDVESENISTAQ